MLSSMLSLVLIAAWVPMTMAALPRLKDDTTCLTPENLQLGTEVHYASLCLNLVFVCFSTCCFPHLLSLQNAIQ